MSQISMKLETIGPKKAQDYLRLNLSNRPVNESNIAKLADAISSNEFLVNGDSIKFDDNGNLADGQHRLLAILATGQAIQTYVVRGLPIEAFDTIDQGKARSLADVLARDGVKNYKTVASATRWLLFLLKQTLKTNAKMHQYIKQNQEILDSVEFVSKFRGIKFSRGLFSALHTMFCRIDVDQADDFIEKVLGGENLSRDMNEFVLRAFLIKDAASAKQYRSQDIAIAVVKCWNAKRRGKVIKRLQIIKAKDSDRKAEIFPEVI